MKESLIRDTFMNAAEQVLDIDQRIRALKISGQNTTQDLLQNAKRSLSHFEGLIACVLKERATNENLLPVVEDIADIVERLPGSSDTPYKRLVSCAQELKDGLSL